MATQAAQLRHQPARRTVSWSWFREFLRWELAPYPGRMNTVVRMTITATLAMIIVVTFHIPNPFLAAFFSILMARENLTATWRGASMVVLGFAGASLYTLLGATLFRGYPIAYFFWVIGSLYLIFFVIRTASNYLAASAFTIPIAVALPLWDRSLPSEAQVEGTLRFVLIVAIGAGVTVVTEAVYRIFDRSDPLIVSVDDMLLAVQQVVERLATLHAPSKPILDRVRQYEMIGTGRLRAMLQRQGLDPAQRARRSALISLAGRLIGFAASLDPTPSLPRDSDLNRMHRLSERLGAIRTELRQSGVIAAFPAFFAGQPSSSFPILQEMERTVALIPEVLQPTATVEGSPGTPERSWWRTLFLPDALQNPEYKRFALAGCLAASVCYVLYNALDWPDINTSVLTCIVTALSTIGASLQAQFLRLAGFVVGGLLLGISAQILILPGIDSIFGFALFFAVGTAIAAWFATSSPRLSYFGVQMALAFYFVNLQGSEIQTDLTIARDKVIAVLLGILAMGFIFDRFGTRSDAVQLQNLLVRNLRMLAQLGASPVVGDRTISASQISRLRSQINDNFASLESQMDAVRFEFEFRHRREKDVVECERIRRAQPALRAIYLMELSLLSHRGRKEIDSELTQEQNQASDHFLNEYSDNLIHTAAWFAHEETKPTPISDDSIRRLQQALESHSSANSQAIADICQRMVASLLMLQNEC